MNIKIFTVFINHHLSTFEWVFLNWKKMSGESQMGVSIFSSIFHTPVTHVYFQSFCPSTSHSLHLHQFQIFFKNLMQRFKFFFISFWPWPFLWPSPHYSSFCIHHGLRETVQTFSLNFVQFIKSKSIVS